ncbi:thioesterase domain-containing protein [Pendulispora brunnea]|uniref:Thioesterase domain-containing protein n=1 Tax=Pendulispora brunnea TaxID=2905690 RepID=A0ABZ2KP45_9BACT
MEPNQNKRKWLLRRPKDDAPARIFCLPYSGCGASMYSRWPERIGPAEVCLLQPPGRENRLRDAHYGTYEALAADLVPVLLPYLDRPFAFFGHCGGALPGFATALHLTRALQERGPSEHAPVPSCLFISSQVAPHRGPYGRFLSMDDGELAIELEGLVRAMGGVPDPSLVELGLEVLRADVEANKGYRLDAPVKLPCAITVFGWEEDREVAPSLMEGWDAYTEAGSFRQIVLEGSHYEFLKAPMPLLAEMASDMRKAIERYPHATR